MDTRYCSACVKKLSPSFFFRDASSLPPSKVFATCYICREKSRKKKRPALQEIDPNIGPPSTRQHATSTSQTPSTSWVSFSPSVINHSLLPPINPLLRPPPPIQPPDISPPSAQRRATLTSQAPFLPSVINQGPIPPVQPPVSPVQPPQPPPPNSFLPADQWQRIRDFQVHMSTIEMETCTQCKARWFDMKLKDGICYNCVFKDKGGQTLYLFSAENKIDLGIVLAHFLALTQQRT